MPAKKAKGTRSSSTGKTITHLNEKKFNQAGNRKPERKKSTPSSSPRLETSVPGKGEMRGAGAADGGRRKVTCEGWPSYRTGVKGVQEPQESIGLPASTGLGQEERARFGRSM